MFNSVSATEEMYCNCNQPAQEWKGADIEPMILCDSCEEWYHLACVGIMESETMSLGRWFCVECKSSVI